MDISKWLDEVAAAEKLVSFQSAPIPALRGREKGLKRKHTRERSRTDSSLLESLSPRPTTTTRPRNLPSEGGTDESAHGEHPGHVRGDPTRFSTSSERYARRPRRKTRPGRYEHSPKVAGEWGRHVHRSRKGVVQKTQGKSKRKHEKKHGSGVGQDFYAKNVTGDRLTLKPREHWGLFNKGKTSTAVKGRGVPDLVFSEMKFLQKHEEQSSLPRRPENTKSRRKRDHVHSKEGEISAYFTTVRPTLVEKDHSVSDCRRAHVKESVPISVQQDQKPHPLNDAAVPTIEAPTKASYLGFGSRRPHHDSTSYVTWSESGRAHSTTPARPLDRSSTRELQVRLSGRNHNGRPMDSRRGSSVPRAPPAISRLESSRSSKRLEDSSPHPSRRSVFRSRSFPQRTSSPRRINAIDQVASCQQADNAASTSSMPPSLPTHVELKCIRPKPVHTREKETCASTAVPYSKQVSLSGRRRHRESVVVVEEEEEEEEAMYEMAPSTASDLDRTIQQCNKRFQQRSRPTTAHHNFAERCERSHSARRARSHRNPDLDVIPRVRFAGTEPRRPALANIAGPGVYEQQAQYGRSRGFCLEEAALDSCCVEADYMDHDDKLFLEEAGWEEELPEETFAYRQGADGLDSGMYGRDIGLESDGLVQHVASGDSVVAAGFWRPNRLY